MIIKNECATYIYVKRHKNKIFIQMDSCEAELSVKEAKELIDAIRTEIIRPTKQKHKGENDE